MPIINETAWQDLTQKIEHFGAGAEGTSAEQVVRCAIVKQLEDYSYDELTFHIVDSRCCRVFCCIGFTQKRFQKSVLGKNIKRAKRYRRASNLRQPVDFGPFLKKATLGCHIF